MEALLLAVALGGILVAALGRARRARRGPEGPRLGFEARSVAHRGGAGERIENTLEAFEHAVQQGAQLLELDVRRTRDGVAVVCHEPVGHLRFRELPLYRCPLEVTFSPGHFSCGRDRRIPRLDEVFRRFPGQPISVEVKDDDDDLINEVATLVRSFDRAPITLWASFREPILRKCRKAHPAMPFSFSVRRGLLALLLHCLGLLPWLPLREALLLFPLPSAINRTFFPIPRGWAGHVLSRAAALVLSPSLLRELRSRGIQVCLWVANEERDFAEAFGLGASGVVTDYPTRLRKFLEGSRGPSPTPRPGPLPHGGRSGGEMRGEGGEKMERK